MQRLGVIAFTAALAGGVAPSVARIALTFFGNEKFEVLPNY